MTSYFDIDELPGSVDLGVSRDVARWQDVWDTAETVFKQCVEVHDSAGWGATGKFPPDSALVRFLF